MPFVDNIKTVVKRQLLRSAKKADYLANGACLVLLYHRVADYQTDPQQLCVTPKNFDAHIAFLKEHYNLLSVENFTEILLNQSKFPKKSVLVTFDDGYADNFLFALPILEKYQTQALFYVCTGNLNSDREFWWDEVERHILLSEQFPKKFEIDILGKSFLANDSKDDRMKLYQNLLPALRALTVAERNQVMSRISKITGNTSPRSELRSMTFDELRSMTRSASSVIGAHTVNHPSLAGCPADEQQFEILKSKEFLEDLLKIQISHFSYPFGTKSDFDQTTLKIVNDIGFKVTAANFPYIVNRNSHPHAFPRFLVRDWSLDEFSKQLKSFTR
jgi:peptidoglycan/xylan/chitin deacetylase (PgdA/CDA1 family)